MLFLLALLASYAYGEAYSCETGRGLVNSRVMMASKAKSTGQCVELVKENEPTADGATWMQKSGRCWAEFGKRGVRNAGPADARYMSCTLGDVESSESVESEPIVESESSEPIIESESAEIEAKCCPVEDEPCFGRSSCITPSVCCEDGTWEITSANAPEGTCTRSEPCAAPPRPPTPIVFEQVVTLAPVVEKPRLMLTGTLKEKGRGGCSCAGQLYCRKDYKIFADLDLLECKDKALELGAKGLEWSVKSGCMTHMSEPTGGNLYPGVTCYEVIPTPPPQPVVTLTRKGMGGCSCKGELYCRTGYEIHKDLTLDECKDKAFELGAKALEYSKKSGCMTHMSEATGGNFYPGVTCYTVDVVYQESRAFATTGSQRSTNLSLLVNGFALIGVGVLLYGAGQHYMGK